MENLELYYLRGELCRKQEIIEKLIKANSEYHRENYDLKKFILDKYGYVKFNESLATFIDR
jgi:hypothetical protein